ncbi:MAG TPA: prepilin-type N-terminal cleavage/methylation domain-containing protein [Phycisphaerae bacterium]|nr:prepilin-type N-terminal cleavage/methylation domain-containing protein [Phycisphaerae bacterium]
MTPKRATTRDVAPGCGRRPAFIRGGGRGVRAFSLLEVVIALALIIALMGGVYGFYVGTMKSRETAIRSMRDTLLMRALLEQIAEELRHISDVVPDNAGFRGTEEELTFVRLVVPDMGTAYGEFDPLSNPKPGQQDMMRVTYKLQWDEEEENLDEDGTPVCYGLLRTQQSPIDPNPSFQLSPEEAAKYEEETGFSFDEQLEEEMVQPVTAELIAPEIKFLRFEYFDGAEWHDTWQTAAEAAEAAADAGGLDESGSTGDGGSGGDGTGGDGTGGLPGGGGGDRSGGLSGGGLTGGGTSGEGANGQQVRVLPQAIRITVGKIKEPRLEDDLDLSRTEEEKEEDARTYHPDRWTITVYLRQSDQSQLSSRKYGLDNDLDGEGAQMGEQTEGGGI